MEIALYICIFFCGWFCCSLASYIMSLGYSVIFLKGVLRDCVYMVSKIVEVAYLINAMRALELEKSNPTDRERENHKKVNEIQMNNMKNDIVNAIVRNFPVNHRHLLKFTNWETMMAWLDAELKNHKEAQ